MVKDNIVEYVSKITRELKEDEECYERYTAVKIAGEMGLSRNTVSAYLNQLSEEGALLKINSRPVYFLEKGALEEVLGVPVYEGTIKSFEELWRFREKRNADVFEQVAGCRGSLKQVINQVKIAVMYPPNGLPILIQGSTGVGKNHMAHLAYEYARQQGILEPNAPFLTFNCAQYYNNAELLSSNLFGYAKGSFTGAVSDKKGLLEEADQGILFLDEVHRLGPEGQEKLFTFLDKGVFRRMGETSGWRTAKVRFIFATTQNTADFMLETFYRRIPIVVRIPDLRDRVKEEKLQLIYTYFIREAKNIGRSLAVSQAVIDDMLSFKYEGNIGELVNIVQYMCGNALIKSQSGRNDGGTGGTEKDGGKRDGGKKDGGKKDGGKRNDGEMDGGGRDSAIRITRQCFPSKILRRLSSLVGYQRKAEDIFISPEAELIQLVRMTDQDAKSTVELFETMIARFDEMKKGDLTRSALEKAVYELLNTYLDRLYFEGCGQDEALNSYYERVLAEVFRWMEGQSGLKVSGGASHAIALYLAVRRSQANLLGEGSVRRLYQIGEHLSQVYEMETQQVRVFLKVLGQKLEQDFGKEDEVFFTFYFKCMGEWKSQGKIKPMILCHGYSTAGSIANVANRILKTALFEAVDMPIDAQAREVAAVVSERLETLTNDKELLLLVDTGALCEIYEELWNVKNTVAIINNVSTQMAVGIGAHILQDQKLEQVMESAAVDNPIHYQIFCPDTHREKLIVTTCMTGVGTAVKIKNMLDESFYDVANLKVEAVNYNRLRANGRKDDLLAGKEVLAVIGTDNPKIPGIPFIPVEKLILGQDEGDLENLFGDTLTKEHKMRINNRLIGNFSLENMVGSITIIDPKALIKDIEAMMMRYERYTGRTLRNDLKINLYIHLSGMMERLVRNNPITEYEGLDQMREERPDFLPTFRRAFEELEKKYGVSVNEEEIGIIYEILKNANEIERGGN